MIRVISLFDGVSCTRQALDNLGIPVKYFASEVDPKAIEITQRNFPDVTQIGDVKHVSGYNSIYSHHGIDLLIGGSPCQDLSFAGHQAGLKEGTRSSLFFEYVRILREVQVHSPDVVFILENVKMSKKNQNIISQELGVEPVEINASLVSAQNRRRLFWCNRPIRQPQDLGLVMNDILEDGFVSDRNKSFCIDANYFKGGNLKTYFEKHRRQLVFSKDGLCHVGDADIKGIDSIKRVYHKTGKAPTLTTMGGGHREPKVLCGAFRGRYNSDGSTSQQLELRFDDKTNSLTTVQKDNVAVLPEELKWRKLTVKECERLQGMKDDYTKYDSTGKVIANTHRYKAIGNAFNVPVIQHILSEVL